MAEQVPAAPLQNQVQDVIDVALAPAVPAPGPVFAAPVAQVENRPPAAADNVAQNAPPEVTVPNVLIPSLFFSFLSTRVPFLSWFSKRCLLYFGRHSSFRLGAHGGSSFCYAQVCSHLCGSLAFCKVLCGLKACNNPVWKIVFCRR